MTQTDNNSYFSLNNPAINNKPQPTTSIVNTSQHATPKVKSGSLLNRRQQQQQQQHAAYLQPLELPSLPPLSQLLPNKSKKESNNPTATQVSTDAATVAAAVAAGMIPDLSYQPKNNVLFNEFNTNNNTAYPNAPTSTTATTTATTNMAQLMDPVAVAAAATAVTTNDFPTDLPLDSIYNMQPTVASMDPTTTTAPPSTMYLSNFDHSLMQQHQPPISLPMQPHHQQYQQQQQQQQQQQHQQRARQLSSSSSSSAEKQYSFVAIPGTNQKKRPRRRYDEIERLYHCTWAGCSKAYGTLNHLNAHVSMQKHGPKRHPAEFKEMRKLWRKQKKEREAHKKRNEEVMKQHMTNQSLPLPPPPPSLVQQHQHQQQQPQNSFHFNSMPVNGGYY